MLKALQKQDMDLTRGPLGRKMLLFALPLALTGILQQLFNAADVAVVGRFVGKDAMAAVGSNSPIVGLLVNLFVGVSLGANVVISTAIGSGDQKIVRKAVRNCILFSVMAGLAMLVIGELFARPILTATGVPDGILPMALAYLRIYCIGLPVIFLYNFEAAIFRSMGDTRTPLICLVLSGLMNVAGNLFFVIVLKMSADGVALSTVLSCVFSAIFLFVLLLKEKSMIRLDLHELRIDRPVLIKMLRIGLPAGLQGMVFSFSNLIIQSAVNSLGPGIMAASAAAFNIEILAYYIVNSFGQACTTFTGQNVGAGKPERCKRTLLVALLQSTFASGALLLCLLLPGKIILQLFTNEPQVIEDGFIRLTWILGFEALNGLIEVFSGALRGHGRSLAPALLALTGICGTRVLWVFSIFQIFGTFSVLMMVYPISWVVTSAALLIYYFPQRKSLYAFSAT